MNEAVHRYGAKALQRLEPAQRQAMRIRRRQLGLLRGQRKRRTTEMQELKIADHRVDRAAKQDVGMNLLNTCPARQDAVGPARLEGKPAAARASRSGSPCNVLPI